MMILQSDLLSRRRPIIRLGQSNIAGSYRPDTDWPLRLQFAQDPIHCYNLYCHHQEASPTGAYARNDVWHRLAPWQMGTSSAPTPVSGPLTLNWGADLADGLTAHGVQAALLDYCYGAAGLAYFTPGVTGSAYTTIIAWIQARIAELVDPLDPVLVMYQGESGTGNGAVWQDYMALIAAQMRTDLACADMGIVIVQLPATYAPGAGIAAQQALYPPTDARSRLAYAHDTTFITDPGPADLHIDTASGRRLAIGPDNGAVVKSVLSCIEELI
jgi:hypothetical protein